jgi:hypothetical protein
MSEAIGDFSAEDRIRFGSRLRCDEPPGQLLESPANRAMQAAFVRNWLRGAITGAAGRRANHTIGKQ